MKIQNDSSISYFFRNFFYLLPLGIIAAVWFGIAPLLSGWVNGTPVTEPKTTVALIVELFRATKPGVPTFVVTDFYADIYSYVSLISFVSSWWLGIIGFAIGILTLCCMFSAVDRHMRLGARQYERLFGTINNTIIPVLLYVLIAIAVYELCAVIMSALIYVLTLSLMPLALFIVSIVIIAVFFFIMLLLLTLTCLTIPSRLMDGYKFNVAISYSCQLVGKSFWRIFSRLISIVLVSGLFLLIPRIITTYFPFTGARTVDTVISVLFYLFWIEMLPVFATRTYFNLTDGKRKDIKQQLF